MFKQCRKYSLELLHFAKQNDFTLSLVLLLVACLEAAVYEPTIMFSFYFCSLKVLKAILSAAAPTAVGIITSYLVQLQTSFVNKTKILIVAVHYFFPP